jgi:hypothetical protein
MSREGDEPFVMGQGKCIRATDKAVLVRIDDKEIWVPQSVVHADSDVYRANDEGKVVVQAWWAERNGYA